MNKGEIVEAVAARLGGTKGEAAKALDAVCDVIAEALAAGGDAKLPGFGTFEVRETAERQGHNPRTGGTVTIAASRQPRFKAGAALRKAVARTAEPALGE